MTHDVMKSNVLIVRWRFKIIDKIYGYTDVLYFYGTRKSLAHRRQNLFGNAQRTLVIV